MLTRRHALAGGLSTASLAAAGLDDRMTGDLSPVHDP